MRTSTLNRPRDMDFRVRTTLDIDVPMMQRLRDEAERRGTEMSLLVEADLRPVLIEPAPTSSRRTELSPLPTWEGGKQPVDNSDRELPCKAMEGA